MNRSPLFYPLSRGLDADAGGAADLQTDVMRFMAILSMCLVAIFALVQSIPLAPATPQPADRVVQVTEPAVPQPIEEIESEKPIELTRPTPVKLPVREAPVALERPKPKPVERRESVGRATVPDEEPEQISVASTASSAERRVTPGKVQKGFTLRFESDAALSQLVEREVVGLYAISPSSIHRMQLASGRMSFWPASAPQRFHEMDVATVPSSVIDAWRKSQSGNEIKWGVSLPAPMARDLNDYLEKREGGVLVIGRDGQLRLEE